MPFIFSGDSESSESGSIDSFFYVPSDKGKPEKESSDSVASDSGEKGFSDDPEKKSSLTLDLYFSGIKSLPSFSSGDCSSPQSPSWVPNTQDSKHAPLLKPAEKTEDLKKDAKNSCLFCGSLTACLALVFACCFKK